MSIVTYLVCAIVWGTTWYAIRVCIAPGGYAEWPAAALRFTLAAALLWAVVAVRRRALPVRTRRQWWWLNAAGALNAASYGSIYYAEQFIPGGLTAALFGTYPLVVAAFAMASGTERVRGGALAGSLLSGVGIAIVMWERMGVSSDQAIAIAFVLGAVACSAGYSVIIKRVATDGDSLAVTTSFLTRTAVLLWVCAAVAGELEVPWPPPAAPTAALLYLGVIGSALVFLAYFALLRRVSLMTVSTLVFIQPVIALIVDALWERDLQLPPRAYAGVAVVLAGIAVNLISQRRRAA